MRAALLIALLWIAPARAEDLHVCEDGAGHKTVQDWPCGEDPPPALQESADPLVIVESERKAAPRPRSAPPPERVRPPLRTAPADPVRPMRPWRVPDGLGWFFLVLAVLAAALAVLAGIAVTRRAAQPSAPPSEPERIPWKEP